MIRTNNDFLKDIANDSASALNGEKAVTVQSYLEVNAKTGRSFELSSFFEGTQKNQPEQAVFLTGNLPVILKDRSFGYTGSAIKADIYTGVTYTGGIAIEIQNANDINPVATTVTVLQDVTITNLGNKFAATAYLLGGESGQNKGLASQTVATEYILKPNTAYIFQVESMDNQSQDIAVRNSWFEGEPDLPL